MIYENFVWNFGEWEDFEKNYRIEWNDYKYLGGESFGNLFLFKQKLLILRKTKNFYWRGV